MTTTSFSSPLVRWSTCAIGVAIVALQAGPVVAQAAVAEQAGAFTIADGTLSLESPAGWQRVQPKSGIVETEFSIPSEGNAADGAPLPAGRMTVMGAGGTVEANVERWYGQFSQPDGGSTKDKATTKKLKIAGREVTLVDVSGTFKDSPGGPFAGGKTIERPAYRMLAAIIEGPGGNYFLKFYGPAATVEKHAAGFRGMVEGMVPASK
ncbi:MAG: hypothetical protein K8S94_06470 [Planctomycetia bacterium]|nr:hypothetical protein [Planctomycetia bacterium]